jgi:nucleotide-binding universal stress UspA family protein
MFLSRDPNVTKEMRSMGTIVVGVDGSKGAQLALEWAVAQARAVDGRIKVVYAPPIEVVPELIVYRAGGTPGPTREERIEVGEQLIDEALGAAGQLDGVQVDKEVALGGGAAKALIDASTDADLLVVGSRGLGGFRGLLVGSVSQQCVAHAPCPVVVVPPPR